MRENIGDLIRWPANRRQAGQGIRDTQRAPAGRSLTAEVGIEGRRLVSRAQRERRLFLRGGGVHRESSLARHFHGQRPKRLVMAGRAVASLGPGAGTCLEQGKAPLDCGLDRQILGGDREPGKVDTAPECHHV